MRHPSQLNSGFSLIEVVLAIGIAALALTAIGGYFSVASQSTQNATRDTLLTSMVNQAMNDLRSVPFDTLWDASPRATTPAYFAGLATNPNPTPRPDAPQVTDYYFSSEGVLLPNDNTSSHADALYHCRVTKALDYNTKSFDATAKYNRLLLTLRFDWPVPTTGTSSGSYTETVYESVTRYY